MSSDTQSQQTLLGRTERERVYEAFTDEFRRYVVWYLGQNDGPVSRDELTVAVAEWHENATADPAAEVTEDEIAVALHHVHLPKLADNGLVERTQAGATLTQLGQQSLSLLGDGIENDPSGGQ